MTAEELRIGNWVKCGDRICKVLEVYSSGLKVYNTISTYA
jgi:hypothetical protein